MCCGCGGFLCFLSPPYFVPFERTGPAASMRPACVIYLYISNKARPMERSDRGYSLPIGNKISSYRFFLPIDKKPLHTGVRTGCHFLISLNRPPVCVCETFVVFTDCESCTMPISKIPKSMEAAGYGLTHGACFVARRPEVVAIAGLLWISWCFLGGVDFFVFFLLRTHTACRKYKAALPHLPIY